MMTLAHQSLVHEVPNLLALGALGAAVAVAVTFLTAVTLKVSRAR